MIVTKAFQFYACTVTGRYL